jgi:hypothetical protein
MVPVASSCHSAATVEGVLVLSGALKPVPTNLYYGIRCVDSARRSEPGRTQRYIRLFVMSSSQSLTTTESLGYRGLLAAIGPLLAMVHWLGQGLRNLSGDDKRQLDALNVGLRWWAFAPIVKRPSARVEPVLWFDSSGGRASPAPRPQFSLAVDHMSHCLAPPHGKQAADVGGDSSGSWSWS